jgi:hypothetical protein
VKLIATRFGDNLHDTSGALSVLWFIAAGLHLNFLYERQVDACRKRSIHAGINADATERTIGDVDAIRDILIFQTAAARDGRITGTGTTARGYARARVEEAGHVASYRNARIERVVKVGADCG